jgi:hypothetical protein
VAGAGNLESEATTSKASEGATLSDVPAFQDADLDGKARLGWDGVISPGARKGYTFDTLSIHPCFLLRLATPQAFYPIGGWWKENPAHQRYDRAVRYALIVSIRAVNGTIDIYTPVMTKIATLVELPT